MLQRMEDPKNMFTLDQIVGSKKQTPLRCIIYGPAGVGKTTLASRFPSPILLRVEDGAGELDIPTFPQQVRYLQELDAAITALKNGQHEFKTLIVDSIDWLEPIVWQYVCEGAGKKSIEEFGYGKGYVLACDIWRKVLAKIESLKAVGMNVVLIAHGLPVKFDPPDSDSYMRYDVKLHSKSAELVKEWADSIFFIQYQVRVTSADPSMLGSKGKATGDGTRVIYTAERPAYIAKSRKALPPVFPIEKIEDYGEFLKLVFEN